MIGIDPGTTQSAIVRIDDDGKLISHKMMPNRQLEKELRHAADAVAIEMIACQGMAVGQETFFTCVWIGQFISAAHAHVGVCLVYRRDVKLHLCGNQRAKDANVRQALIDRYGSGSEKKGKRCPKCKGEGFRPRDRQHWYEQGVATCPKCHGAKWLKPPGKLAGIKDHEWAALAVAVTAQGNPGCLIKTD